jgi:ornithine cyclodeaminase
MAAALLDADIICTTTSATEPFLAAAMVPAGAHLNAVGGSMPYLRELLPDCVPALSFFTDYRPSLEAQAGEVIDARALGHVSADWQATEIGEVIAGTRPGRASDAQRTVYRSLGVASQDLAAADFIVARAIERKCGVEIAWH